MEPTKFHFRQTPESLTALGGFPLIGQAMARFSQLRQLIDPRFPVRTGIPNSDILLAQLGLLCQGKSDFEAIERYRREPFFSQSLGLRAVPASATLRQRLDEKAEAFLPWVDEANLQLLLHARVDITPLSSGWVPLDLDVFTLDNSNTRKEGIGWTYAGFVGYAPIAAYLGQEGWNIGMELREGTQHSAEQTDATLDRVLPRAMALTPLPVLVRMDAGFHGKAIAHTLDRHHRERQAAGGQPIAFLIKWNRRGHDIDTWIRRRLAAPEAVWECPRPGKRVTVWEEEAMLGQVPIRRILRLTERHTLASGQHLLLPEHTLEGWDTTLPTGVDPHTVIALYADHATHEQFHAEIKTDLDLERLPSGKFATNDLILTLGAMAYNLLRLVGQNTLLGPDAPPRHPARRRRVKTVIQEVITQAARVVHHARQWILSFPETSPGFFAIQRLYDAWSAP
ncbi:IS1380 family transposase [Acidithiobacillus sp. CV18-2]|nr:IS1380 family transposase [Acidithiobacillus sp. CV18-3]MBU2758143.1 IS1380 family transposase [Acidithiobacillus sp. BN09-2]MBU2777420.1 IS1380 family transposase [Acidithiobacillus sp. CV18-2]MBU2800185.1 IS1380 family transposase [Acidithiobacillus sp. VAN18-4]